jgi:hypothetical protein
MPHGTAIGRRKYLPLQRYLLGLAPAVQEVTLTFPEVEEIIGAPLPASAALHNFWMAGSTAWNWQRVSFAARLLRGGLVTEHAVRFTRQAPRRR